MEIWKDIDGYEGLYQVSNYGRIKSLEKILYKKNRYGNYMEFKFKSKLLKPCVLNDDCGHLQVDLHKDKTRKHKLVHVLVAEAFIPNPNGYTVVHHIDHDPTNNRVENLVWMNREEHDKLHASERAEKLRMAVYQYSLDGKLIAIYISLREAAKQLGFTPINISRCCNGGYYHYGKWINSNTAYGYKWSYTPL